VCKFIYRHSFKRTNSTVYAFGQTAEVFLTYAQYTPPTRLNSTVESRRRRRCVLGFRFSTI